MARLLTTAVLLFLALNSYLVEGQGSRVGVAKFNAKGVKGYIRFTEMDVGVRIEASLEGLIGDHGWHVHNLPVDQTVDSAVQCLSTNVGPHYDPFNENDPSNEDGGGYKARCRDDPSKSSCEAGDLAGKFGLLSQSGEFNMVDLTGTLFLRNQFSIIGRSVVIHSAVDGTNFECATIRTTTEIGGAEVTVLQASFVQPLAGTMYFRQVDGEEVQMWGKVYWTSDNATSTNHNWHIHLLAPGEEYRRGYCNTSSNILGHYRPFENGPPSIPNYDQMCRPNLTSGCEVGDLTGKHATITVYANPSPYREAFFFTDNFLNLTGENPVINRSVAIHDPIDTSIVIACAPLVESENIVLRQYKVGDISMSQRSPFEDTVLTSSNTRTMTTLQDFAFNQLIQNCVAGSQVFSPFAPVNIREPGVATPDKYSLGDLQTRYSAVAGAVTQRLFDVPIYGAAISISSLNLRTVNSESTSCSALIPMLTSSNVILAKVSFSRVVRGAVYFVQNDNGFDQLGNTHVIVDVYYADAGTEGTTGHNWHVHRNPSPNGGLCSPTVGLHYNPFNVELGNANGSPELSMNSNYSTDCSPRYQLRCESGDMGSKHGRLSIEPDSSSRPTYTYVDSNVLLTGSFSIVGRSIALHDIIENAPIFDCGTVSRVYLSTQEAVIRTRPSDMLRTSLTSVLAEDIDNVDPTDILVLNQEVSDIGFGFNCVDISVRVLGPSTDMANTYVRQVQDKADGGMFTCDGAPRSASITLATLFLPLIVAALHVMGFTQ